MSLSRLQRFQYFAWAAGTLWTGRNSPYKVAAIAANGADDNSYGPELCLIAGRV